MEPTELLCYESKSATVTESDKTISYETQKDDIFPKRLNCKDSEYVRVELSAGMTINMGNFQSLRVDARLSVPSEADPVQLEKTFQNTKQWLSNAIQELKEEAMGGAINV